MSVNYYSCDVCREARYEEYVSSCNECGASLCDDCVVNTDEDWFELINSNGGEVSSENCPYCTGNEIDSTDLLNFIVDKYEIDLNLATEEYRKQRIN